MSYEGYDEYLCESGHYLAVGVYASRPDHCDCGARLAYRHGVDQTNGYVEDLPDTMPAPKREIGFDDIPHVDHHGNKFFIKLLRYEPLTGWTKVHPPTP